jgi:hypothetical protein
MSIRLSRLAMSLLFVATVVLMSGRCWAIFNMLPPSNDEWGLKYDLEVTAVDANNLNVRFTLADAGRLRPIYSATVVAFSKPDTMGGQSYLVKSRIKLTPTKDGKAAGQVQIRKDFLNIAMIRILTLTVDRRRQTEGAAYYDIPIRRFLDRKALAAASPEAPASITARSIAPSSIAAPTIAAPLTSKVTK